jgi:hypothetical protein
MKGKVIILVSFIFLSFVFFGCTTIDVKKPPLFSCERDNIILTKDAPKNIETLTGENKALFSPTDRYVIASLRCKNLSGQHTVKWEWYDPSGKLYLSTGNAPFLTSSEGQQFPSKDKYHKEAVAWNRISVRGEKAESYLGDWQVNISLDKNVIATRTFTLEEDINEVQAKTGANPKYWGLIIGVENYAQLPSVIYAKRDSVLMKKYFGNVMGIPAENIVLLNDGEATKARITGYLKDYFPVNMGKDGVLYVFFAGHGAYDTEKQEPYLIPYDGDLRFIKRTGYRLKDFYEDLDNLPVKRTIVFLDSCFSGSAARSDKMLDPTARPVLMHLDDPSLSSNKVVSLIASTGVQTSASYPEKELGLFTYFLARGLRGEAKDQQGLITIGDLYSYIKDNVTKVSRRRGIEQIPFLNPDIEAVKGVEITQASTPEGNLIVDQQLAPAAPSPIIAAPAVAPPPVKTEAPPPPPVIAAPAVAPPPPPVAKAAIPAGKSVEGPAKSFFVTKEVTSMRAEPNLKSKVVLVLKKGRKVEKLDESGEFVRVKLSWGDSGWVQKRFLEPAP